MIDKKEYMRIWRIKNKDKLISDRAVYYLKNKSHINIKSKLWRKENNEKVKITNKLNSHSKTLWVREYRENNPWYSSYEHARSRCNYSNNKYYYRYGGRGIKFLMTEEDFKYLWIRDNAENMKCPNIDRINNDGNYELSNCRFIEKSLNSKRRYHSDKELGLKCAT